jgi:hypothetical protein
MKNNYIDFQKAIEFRTAAIADGWVVKPTYDHEPVESAASLKHPEGFTMLIITREHNLKLYPNVKTKYEIDISIWGPDGLAIDVPLKYNMLDIRAGVLMCSNCKRVVPKTVRYSFAGRCCEECLPELRKRFEKPGWCN